MDPIARIAELDAQLKTMLAASSVKDATIADLTAKLQAMELRLSAMQRRIFGRSSEKLHDPGQQILDLLGNTPLPFASAALTTEVTAADQAPAEEVPARRRQRGKRLGRLPDHVEVVERVIDVPEAERIGVNGQPLVRVGEEVVERFGYVPTHYLRERTVRPIYGRPFVDSDIQPRVVAPAPAFLVPKGLTATRSPSRC